MYSLSVHPHVSMYLQALGALTCIMYLRALGALTCIMYLQALGALTCIMYLRALGALTCIMYLRALGTLTCINVSTSSRCTHMHTLNMYFITYHFIHVLKVLLSVMKHQMIRSGCWT